MLKASSAIPGVCGPYEVCGNLYYDGALGDTVPIKKAFQCGCDKVVLILTKPRDAFRTSRKDELLAKRIQKSYPVAAEKLRQRAGQYNLGVALAKNVKLREQC